MNMSTKMKKIPTGSVNYVTALEKNMPAIRVQEVFGE